jgi:hypothetical protein
LTQSARSSSRWAGESGVTIQYRSVDLLWRPVGHLVRFVLVKHPSRGKLVLLSTAMMGVTIAHVVSSAVATAALLPWVGGQASLWATVILTPLMLSADPPGADPAAATVALHLRPAPGVAWLAPVVGIANLSSAAMLKSRPRRRRDRCLLG